MDELDRQRLALASQRAEALAGAGPAVLDAQEGGKTRVGIDRVDVETGKGEVGAARVQHVARLLVGAGIVVELVGPPGIRDDAALL